jgi:hypothetical protein
VFDSEGIEQILLTEDCESLAACLLHSLYEELKIKIENDCHHWFSNSLALYIGDISMAWSPY